MAIGRRHETYESDPVQHLAPAELTLRRLERHNRRAGHENAGFLSAAHGFMPSTPPQTRLSSQFAPWDELARELPALHADLRLRTRIEQLPLLDASESNLDANDLLRASAVLAVLGHAYWYVDTTPPRHLPDALRQPWATVRARLGRRQEVLSYIELIVYNWRLRDAARADSFALENLDLLLPTIGNQEERVFYLTQLEILARTRAVVPLVAAAQTAVVRADAAALEACLRQIGERLTHAIRVLGQIDPRNASSSYVDPVRWAKTVAPFAVPMRRGDLGPSGTSSPLFNTLDVFLGRAQFTSALGREIALLRDTYPPAWRLFLRALGQVSVGQFVEHSGSHSLQDVWAHTLALYAGDQGFLGKHRRKVYGYLEIAFKVGRGLTIGGFGGAFRDRTWIEVDDALASSRAERPQGPERQASGVRLSPQPRLDESEPSFALSEIAAHSCKEHGYWLVVHGGVYDVTGFIERHPGGRQVLQAYAGIDASQAFTRAHAGVAHAEVMLAGLRIGRTRSPAQRSAHGECVRALHLLIEMRNTLALEHAFVSMDECTPYLLQRAAETHRRFLRQYVAVIAEQTLPQLWAAAQRELFPEQPADTLLEWVARQAEAAAMCEQRGSNVLQAFGAGLVCVASDAADGDIARLEALAASDRALLDELVVVLACALRAFEHGGGATSRRVRRACLRGVAVLRRYYTRVG